MKQQTLIKNTLRILVSIIFIASGFVKAVDVRGFSFKMEEYFSSSVFNLPFFEKKALAIAIFVVVLELILGISLLFKIKLKQTLFALITLCVFFAFLTFYSAYFNKVTDCGCFGDAIKFTPWQSFWKDITLLLGLIILWILYKNEGKIYSPKFNKIIALILVVISGFVIFYGIKNEPLIDFRDYKIGTNLLLEKQKIAKNPSEYKTFYTLKNKKTGEEREVNQDDYVNKEEYWKQDSEWEIIENKTTSKIVKKGYQSEIEKFKIEENGEDITNEILHSPKVILVFSYKPEKITSTQLHSIEDQLSAQKNELIYAVSTSENFLKNFKNATMDGTAIKTIARSNPFILVLKNGIIIEKKPMF